jgi:hypothetical protein
MMDVWAGKHLHACDQPTLIFLLVIILLFVGANFLVTVAFVNQLTTSMLKKSAFLCGPDQAGGHDGAGTRPERVPFHRR